MFVLTKNGAKATGRRRERGSGRGG